MQRQKFVMNNETYRLMVANIQILTMTLGMVKCALSLENTLPYTQPSQIIATRDWMGLYNNGCSCIYILLKYVHNFISYLHKDYTEIAPKISFEKRIKRRIFSPKQIRYLDVLKWQSKYRHQIIENIKFNVQSNKKITKF